MTSDTSDTLSKQQQAQCVCALACVCVCDLIPVIEASVGSSKRAILSLSLQTKEQNNQIHQAFRFIAVCEQLRGPVTWCQNFFYTEDHNYKNEKRKLS